MNNDPTPPPKPDQSTPSLLDASQPKVAKGDQVCVHALGNGSAVIRLRGKVTRVIDEKEGTVEVTLQPGNAKLAPVHFFTGVGVDARGAPTKIETPTYTRWSRWPTWTPA